MKTNRPFFTINIVRFAVCISALCLGLGTASVRAAGSATVNLGGATFGRGLDVHLNSGTTQLPPAASYKYSVTGTVHFTGLLALVFPTPIDLGTLVDQIQPGSSALLSGTHLNPTGTLPLKVVNQTFSGSVPVPGGQTLTASVKIVGRVTATGLVRFDLTNVSFEVTNFHLDPGTVVFDSGSLTVDAPSVIDFKSGAIKVSEDVGMAKLTVKRRVSSKGAVSVHFASMPGTATAIDYTPVSGDLNFADGETSKTIDVTIAKRAGTQGDRTFKVKLSAPTGGAFLGLIRKESVKITDAAQ